MSMTTDRKQLEAITKELAKGIKSEKDLSDLSREIIKMTVDAALRADKASKTREFKWLPARTTHITKPFPR